MSAQFYTGRSFHSPAFRIELDGGALGRAVLSDVLEVSFTDELDAIDSLEFVLHDWDPVALRPKYSSPWDDNGRPLRVYEGGPEIPGFEPGTKVALYFGYQEDGELPLMLDAEIVSLAPSFPAGGVPTCRVRALDAFLLKLQRIEVSGTYSGTAQEVVDKLCAEHGFLVRWAGLEDPGEAQESVAVAGSLLDVVLARVEDYGLTLGTLRPGGPDGPNVLDLAKDDEPVAELVWGRTLVSFSPAFSTAGLAWEVVVHGSDPEADVGEQRIEVVRSWDDVELLPDALGPGGLARLKAAAPKPAETIKPDGVTTRANAEKAATAYLREAARRLITGSGSSIGLPELRAGRTVALSGLGARFNGVYRLTRTTHTIGGSGYTTSFEARKLLLAGQEGLE